MAKWLFTPAVGALPNSCNYPLEGFCKSCVGCTAGSLYCLPYIQELVAGGYWDYLNLPRILPTLDNYNWDNGNVAEAVSKMTSSDFQKVAPHCKFERDPGPSFIDADQYKIFYDGAHLSLKVALVEDDGGELAGLITFHSC